jgi:transposase
MARPTDFSETIAKELCDYLRAGLPVSTACARAGIGRSTYHRWIQRGEQGEEPFATFRDASKRARAEAESEVLEGIKAAGVAGQWQAYAWLAERLWGHSKRIRVEQAAPDPAEGLTDAEIEARLQRLQRERGGEEE